MKKIITLSSIVLLSTMAATPMSFAEDAKIPSIGRVTFKPGTGLVSPIDPEHPDKDVKPVNPLDPNTPQEGTAGPLSLDFVSNLDFGENEITTKDATYFARAQEVIKDGESIHVPNYVQVTDLRGTNEGWHLKVKQNGQFSTGGEKAKTLEGATITFKNPNVNSMVTDQTGLTTTTVIELDGEKKTEATVFSAAKDSGSGTWANYWGKSEEIKTTTNDENKEIFTNESISLTVPGKSTKLAAQYNTELVWSLSNVPAPNK